MCSIGEEDFGDEGGLHTMHPDPVTPSAAATPATPTVYCTGCPLPEPAIAAVKLPCKEPQCAVCFLAYARHKFRANLGANKLIPRNGRVLVCYDGAGNSTALLDMIRYATTMDRFKKLHIEPCVLFIDEHCLQLDVDADEEKATSSPEERQQQLHRIRAALQRLGFAQPYYVSVANSSAATCQPLDLDTIDVTSGCSEAIAAEPQFRRTLAAFGSLTARQEYVHCVRSNIIRECAERLGCEFAFTAETCPDLASKLLANISLGRGSSVADDIGFCDARGDGVRILRPIRDFSRLEIGEYLRLAGVATEEGEATTGMRVYGSDGDEFSSIQNLTRAFVDGLQTEYQSTISTIFRTGSKIAALKSSGGQKEPQKRAEGADGTTGEKVEGRGRCAVCASALDCEGSATLLAVEFSRQCALQDKDKDEVGTDDGESDERLDTCYGCRNVFRDVRDEHKRLDAMKLLKK